MNAARLLNNNMKIFCEHCGEELKPHEIDPENYEQICDKCAEEMGATFTDHQEETIDNLNN